MQSRNLKNILKESFWMATDSIRKNKLRSSLTLLGISIGVFSVIGVMTAIRTLESSVESGLNVFAANTFVIQKNPEFNFGGDRRKYRNRKNFRFCPSGLQRKGRLHKRYFCRCSIFCFYLRFIYCIDDLFTKAIINRINFFCQFKIKI